MNPLPTFRIRDVEMLTIQEPGNCLDPIDVLFLDHDPGRGRLIVRCYSMAWTAWWGAMGDENTVRTFVRKTDAAYIANCLLYGPGDLQRARARKLQAAYVERIVTAIKLALLGDAP
jgi:hypothetical protein